MVKLSFAIADYAVIFAYLLLILGIGYSARGRRRESSEEFLLAGRSLALPVFAATLVVTWYNGVLGVGEFVQYRGVSAWLMNSFPYYLFALVFAWLLAPRVRVASITTIPDRFEAAYGRPAAIAGGVLTFVLTNPAANLLMVGVLLQSLFGLSSFVALVVGAALSTAYLYGGGLKADVRINVLQFALMFAGFAVMLVLAAARFGGMDYLISHLPPTHVSLTGGSDAWTITVWFFIALWTLVEPSFHQRVSAARDVSTARWGLVAAVGCWLAFDGLQIASALYSRAAFGDSLVVSKQALQAFPALAQMVLPAGAKGAFWVGMMSATMAGAIGFIFVSATALGRDILWRLISSGDDGKARDFTRLGILLATLIGIALAATLPSVVKLWYFVGSCVVPALLLPVLGSYISRFTMSGRAATATLTLSFVSALGWFIYGRLHLDANGVEQYPFRIPPLFVGLIMSLVIFATDRAAVSLRRSARA